MKKLPMQDATPQQLATFASTVQQIEKVPKDAGGIVAALVESGWTESYILIDGEPIAPPEASQDAFVQPQLVEAGEVPIKMPATGFGFWRNAPMVICRIMSTDRPGGNEPAHPSINGSPQLVIQRNKLVEIPHDFYEVLKQAGGTKLLPGDRPNDELVRQDYSEYPMTDVVLPSREALVAWREKTSGIELGKPKVAAAA